MIIRIDDLDINYKITGPKGNRKTAVILQGWGTDLSVYDSVAAAINDRYRVVQLDLPGFGDSDEPRDAWSVDDYSAFFCEFMEKLNIKRATLIGHSYGGRMIIKMAARSTSVVGLPFEISKIMLIDSAGVMPERTNTQSFKVKRFKAMKKFLTNKFVHSLFPEVIDYWLSKQGSDDYRKASPVMRASLVKAVNEDLKHLMPKVEQETLLVWGENDPDTPLSDAHIMEELMPNAALVVIEGAGHYSFLEQPALFKNIIRSYLEIDKKPAKADTSTSDISESSSKESEAPVKKSETSKKKTGSKKSSDSKTGSKKSSGSKTGSKKSSVNKNGAKKTSGKEKTAKTEKKSGGEKK